MLGFEFVLFREFIDCFFFFNDTATTEIYTLSLHDALPILKSECLDTEFVIAVDVSDSMHNLNKHFENLNEASPLSHAFLSVLTLLYVCAHFKIPVHVLLFANEASKIGRAHV